MDGKICLVTGANTGIGKYTSWGLADLGAEVIMCARNEEQVEQARQEIANATGNDKLHILVADLSSLQEVVHLANRVIDRYQQLDVLVNNAGLFLTEYRETIDGFETQWAVNYLAPYVLTRRLLPLLRKAPDARIVNVSSNGHLRGEIDFDNLGGKGKYDGLKAYSQSKLANVLFTKQLAKKLEDSQIVTNALHPGVVRTSIGNRYNKTWIAWMWNLGKPFMISVEKGARTSIYLASSPEVATVSGSYFIKSKEAASSPVSNDPDLAVRLWETTEDLVRSYLS